ncbi:MAG: hypothetical protein Q7U53_05285 [Anaerolineaceae bacterium]|nr:hypothetical protein [Anaerolineaceae bacterium]
MRKIITKFKTFTTIIIVLVLSACVNNNPLDPVPTNSEVVNPTSTEVLNTVQPIISETAIESKNLFIHTYNSEIYLKNSENFNAIETLAEELGYEVTQSNELSDSQKPSTIVLLFDPADETITFFDTETTGRFIIVGEEINKTPQRPTTFIKVSKADKIFIAGYLSALITNDWRVGGLLPASVYKNTSAVQIFQNGVIFLCGRCSPTFGPIVNFPVTAILSEPENNEATMQAYGEISNSRINTLFIPSDYLYDDFVTLLKQNNVSIISDNKLESVQSDWVDYAITDNLSDLIVSSISETSQNKSVDTINVDYSIYSRSNSISPGKLTYITEMIETLKSGFISPYQISLD